MMRGLNAIPAKNIEVFLLLQVLDFLTTVVGLELGLSEMSPFVRFLIERLPNPVVAVMLAKFVACGLGAYCIVKERNVLLRWINYWFAALVVWNMSMLYWYAKLFIRR